jgi:hypothetical protein
MRSGHVRSELPEIPRKESAMKMVKALVKVFKKDADLAAHAWILHVI